MRNSGDKTYEDVPVLPDLYRAIVAPSRNQLPIARIATRGRNSPLPSGILRLDHFSLCVDALGHYLEVPGRPNSQRAVVTTRQKLILLQRMPAARIYGGRVSLCVRKIHQVLVT